MRCASCGRDDPFVELMRQCAKCGKPVCNRETCLNMVGGGLCAKC